MYKIAVLGDYNSIYGFAALGLDTFPVEDPAEGKEKLNRLAAGEYMRLFILRNSWRPSFPQRSVNTVRS